MIFTDSYLLEMIIQYFFIHRETVPKAASLCCNILFEKIKMAQVEEEVINSNQVMELV